MRIEGHTFEHIANTLHYHDRSSCHKAIMTALAQVKTTPAAELAAIEQQRLDLAVIPVLQSLTKMAGQATIDPTALSASVLSLVRIQSQRAKYVQVYQSDASGAAHVGGILSELLRGVMSTEDTSDPMTISEPLDETEYQHDE
jgi:hypothetical protein